MFRYVHPRTGRRNRRVERVGTHYNSKSALTLFRRFIREFKDVCLQDGENGNKTFWNAVTSLGRSLSLISKPEAQAAVCTYLRNGQYPVLIIARTGWKI